MFTRRIINDDENMPEDIRKFFHQADNPDDCNAQLWREVLARAVLDAFGFTELSKGNGKRKDIAEARRWFRSNSADMQEVFLLAGIDHVPFCRAMVKHLNER